jgi:hypothetical protein
MTCPKCCGIMERKQAVNKDVIALEKPRFECRCGYVIDEATGVGHWPDAREA